MEKKKITSSARLSGILLGVALGILMLVLSINAVMVSGDFWLKQNDRYNYTQAFKLVSNDDYNGLYHHYIGLLKGKEAPDKVQTVTLQGNPEDFTDTFIKLNGFEGTKNSEYQINQTVEISQQFLQTVQKYSATQKQGIKGNLRFEYVFDLKDSDEIQDMLLNIKNASVTDASGEEYQFTINKFFYNESGNLVTEELEELTEIPFKSNYILGIVVSEEISVTSLNVQFKVSCDLSEYECASVFTYKEKLTNVEVAKKVGYEADILSFNEREQLANAGDLIKIEKIVAVILAILAIIPIVLTVKKQKRQAFLGIGFYTVVSAIVFALIINLLVKVVPSQRGFNLVFNFDPNSTTGIILGQNFMNDFAAGSVRFYDFSMIVPVFVGYILTKFSKTNKEDENEDYLYQ